MVLSEKFLFYLIRSFFILKINLYLWQETKYNKLCSPYNTWQCTCIVHCLKTEHKIKSWPSINKILSWYTRTPETKLGFALTAIGNFSNLIFFIHVLHNVFHCNAYVLYKVWSRCSTYRLVMSSYEKLYLMMCTEDKSDHS